MQSKTYIVKCTPAVLAAVCKQQGMTKKQFRLATLKRVECDLANLLDSPAMPLHSEDRAAIMDLHYAVRLALEPSEMETGTSKIIRAYVIDTYGEYSCLPSAFMLLSAADTIDRLVKERDAALSELKQIRESNHDRAQQQPQQPASVPVELPPA